MSDFTLDPIRQNVLQTSQITKELHSLESHLEKLRESIKSSQEKAAQLNSIVAEESQKESTQNDTAPSISTSSDAPKTSQFYRTQGTLPRRFEEPDAWNYKVKEQNPLYATTANDYGSKRPTVHDMPTIFKGQSTKFSEHLNMAGPYRNFSLNI